MNKKIEIILVFEFDNGKTLQWYLDYIKKRNKWEAIVQNMYEKPENIKHYVKKMFPTYLTLIHEVKDVSQEFYDLSYDIVVAFFYEEVQYVE